MRRHPFWLEAVALLVAALAAAAISNALAGPERELKWIGSYPAAAPDERPGRPAGAGVTPAAAAPAPAVASEDGGKVFPPHPETAWVEISGDDVALLHSRGVLFLDARRTSVYRQGHIAGARPVSVWEADVDEKVKTIFDEGRDQSVPIVVYCSGGDCEDSHQLAQKLYFVGFDNVLVYKDGYPDWEKRGLPVRKGDAP